MRIRIDEPEFLAERGLESDCAYDVKVSVLARATGVDRDIVKSAILAEALRPVQPRDRLLERAQRERGPLALIDRLDERVKATR